MSDPSDLSDFLTATGDAGYEWDLRADHILWFGAWNKLFGTQTPPPANSQGFYSIIYPDDRHIVFGGEERTLDRQYRLHLPNGNLIWVHERGQVETEGGHACRQRGIIRTIEKPHDKIIHSEMHGRDLLTGCIDRGHLLVQIGKAMDAAKAARRGAAYLVVGIDKMSFVNEAVGMEAGDALLRSVAERLAQLMPARAMLGRVGGDMFGILLPEPFGNDIQKMAERILQSFREQPVVTSITPVHITV